MEVVKGSYLLNNIPGINYIKCDIEGYEEYVLPELKEIIQRHKPILQIETWGNQKDHVFNLMQELGYIRYGLHKNNLIKNLSDDYEFLFIHESMEQKFFKEKHLQSS